MFHIQDDIVDFMKINLHFGCPKQENIDDAMLVFHDKYLKIWSKHKLDRVAHIILTVANNLYTHTQEG